MCGCYFYYVIHLIEYAGGKKRFYYIVSHNNRSDVTSLNNSDFFKDIASMQSSHDTLYMYIYTYMYIHINVYLFIYTHNYLIRRGGGGWPCETTMAFATDRPLRPISIKWSSMARWRPEDLFHISTAYSFIFVHTISNEVE